MAEALESFLERLRSNMRNDKLGTKRWMEIINEVLSGKCDETEQEKEFDKDQWVIITDKEVKK